MRHPILTRWSTSLAVLAVAVLAVSLGAAPASAITHGDLDGDAHPYVGLMVAKDADGNPLWRCSGTLLSSTVYLTAGHCTQAPAASADIWFGSDLTDAAAIDFPKHGDASGVTRTHPDYDPANFVVRDVGVVLLDVPYELDQYGALPALDTFDAASTQRQIKNSGFTTVGYGVQKMFPEASAWKTESLRLRMVATPRLVQVNTNSTGNYSLLLSANADTGGACSGDSGGPNFLGDSNVVGAVTSSAKSDLCRGSAGVFRMDRSWALNWVGGYLAGR
ncbi:MAG: trypsin-like serine protease [Ornithinibacter sp.]